MSTESQRSVSPATSLEATVVSQCVCVSVVWVKTSGFILCICIILYVLCVLYQNLIDSAMSDCGAVQSLKMWQTKKVTVPKICKHQSLNRFTDSFARLIILYHSSISVKMNKNFIVDHCVGKMLISDKPFPGGFHFLDFFFWHKCNFSSHNMPLWGLFLESFLNWHTESWQNKGN